MFQFRQDAGATPVPELPNETAALREENALLRAVVDNFPGGILLYDRSLRLVLCNDQQKKLLDYPPNLFDYGMPSLEQVVRFNATRGEYGPGDVEMQVRERMALVARREPHVYERVRPNGTVIEVRGMPLAGGGFVTTYLNVTLQRRGDAAAAADSLTGLPNWTIFQDRLGQAIGRARRGQVAALHYLDIDNYRAVRERMGEAAGELLVQAVARRLRGVLCTTDTIARAGDDEFVMLQPNVARPLEVARLARRLIDSMRQSFSIGGALVTVGASVGVALAPRDGSNAEALIARAKQSLYRTREEIPEQIEFSGP